MTEAWNLRRRGNITQVAGRYAGHDDLAISGEVAEFESSSTVGGRVKK
jgi:hypothetical protein